MFPKAIVFKSRKYLDWIIKQNDCLACPNDNHCIGILRLYIDPHHLSGRSRDDIVVPLCRYHHRLLHDTAQSEWQEVMGFDQKTLEEKAILLREEYEREHTKRT